MRKVLSGLTLLLATLPLAAQQSKPFDFSIKNIMRGPELYGRQPEDVRWSADSKWIYFRWLEPGTDWREQPTQFRVRAVPGARPERVSIQQIDSTGSSFARPERSHNGRFSTVEFNGDVYINDLTTGTTRRLTQTVDAEPESAILGKRQRDLLRPQQQRLLDRSRHGLPAAVDGHPAGTSPNY